MSGKHVLIAGVSGLVGTGALKAFASPGDCKVTAVSRRKPLALGRARFLSVDLTDRDACAATFGTMTDVTHVVYAALFEKPGLVPGWFEQDQIETNANMLANLFDPLEKAATGLRHISIVHGAKAYGGHVRAIAIPAREDRSEFFDHPNFYWQQERYIKAKQAGRPWWWTIFRPDLIIGGAIGCAMNLIPAIGAWAAIVRDGGETALAFPGGSPFVWDAVDSELLGRAIAWAGEADSARNQAFNVTNGDVFTWPGVWPAICDALGMKSAPPKPRSVMAALRDGAARWDSIRANHRLRAPALAEFIGQSHYYADFCFALGRTEPGPPHVLSTVKIKQAGFTEVLDTESMFRRWIGVFQDQRLLPARD